MRNVERKTQDILEKIGGKSQGGRFLAMKAAHRNRESSEQKVSPLLFLSLLLLFQRGLSATGWMNFGVLKWVTALWGEGSEEHSISSDVVNLGSLSAVSIHRSGVHLWSSATVPTNSVKSAVTYKNSRDGRVSIQEEGVCKVLEFS